MITHIYRIWAGLVDGKQLCEEDIRVDQVNGMFFASHPKLGAGRAPGNPDDAVRSLLDRHCFQWCDWFPWRVSA